jgi:acetoin utilization deacetylase AcuC-like enzyme/GNAT superfamily N-acetyltransferase
MIRFGRIFDRVSDADRRKTAEVQALFRTAFPEEGDYAERIPELLEHRHERGYDVVLLTAEEEGDRVIGFALAHYYPNLHYAYLDFIASDPDRRTLGIGGALYEAAREHLARKGARGLFMDVPPDDPALLKDPVRLPVNQQRLKFYEQFGAFPVADTRYEAAPPLGQTYDPPYLVYDPLGRQSPLPRADARKVVREILTKKFGWDARDPHVTGVVRSFRDDPVRLRPPRYAPEEPSANPASGRLRPIKLVVSEHHALHHVRERGYVERPVRVDAILRGLSGLPLDRVPVRPFDEQPIRAVHDDDYVTYLATVCEGLEPGKAVYPYVFPVRRPEQKPHDLATRAGYYCIDTFTPLSRSAYAAARAAVDCAATAADLISQGEQLVYALCRPPGHHAERRVYGGFCYFNNAAVAAHRLSARGRVALVDIDFHHGNGSQDIFYHRDDVLVVSLHGHPNYAYPYFSGFEDERGHGAGLGFNRNYPLPEGVGDAQYLEALEQALREVRGFRPSWLVVSLGVDVMRGDPTGSFVLTTHGMRRIGRALGRVGVPTLVVQEGGYSLRNLARGPRAFFLGLSRAWF